MKKISLHVLREHFPKVNLITHTDLDGYGSAAIMIRILRDFFGYNFNDVRVFHVDYDRVYPLGSGFTIVTDLSIDSKFNNLENMIRFSEDDNNILWWIDHHQTSLDMIDKNPELKKIPRIITTSASATYLCWKLYEYFAFEYIARKTYVHQSGDLTEFIESLYGWSLFEFLKFHDEDDPLFPEQFFGEPREAMRLISSIPGQCPHVEEDPVDRDSDDFYYKVPDAVRYTDDWDTFSLKDNNSIYYNTAFGCCPMFPRDIKHPYYAVFIAPPMDYVSGEYYIPIVTQRAVTRNLIHYGEEVFSMRNYDFVSKVLKDGYVTKFYPTERFLQDKEYRSERRKFENLSDADFITVNDRSINAALALQDFVDEYPFFLAFDVRRTNIIYTVYVERLDKYPFNAKDVASLFGGGGHPGCAGFTLRTPLTEVHCRENFTIGMHRDADIIVRYEPFSEYAFAGLQVMRDRWAEKIYYDFRSRNYTDPSSCRELEGWTSSKRFRNSFRMALE